MQEIALISVVFGLGSLTMNSLAFFGGRRALLWPGTATGLAAVASAVVSWTR